MLSSYKNLIVWQKSIELVVEIYRVTSFFPKSELYGLINHMRKTSVSIPSNIAEGFSRKHKQENRQFVRIAFGSGAELESQIEIAKELFPKIDFSKSISLLEEIMKILSNFVKKLS